MANAGRKIAMNMLDFANGVTKELAPKTTRKAISNMDAGQQARMVKSITSNAGKLGVKTGDMVKNNTMTTGIAKTIYNMDGGMGFKQAVKQAHTGANGQISKRKVAGTVATVGIAGRVASGGGLYRDRYGNVNVPGVPFI